MLMLWIQNALETSLKCAMSFQNSYLIYMVSKYEYHGLQIMDRNVQLHEQAHVCSKQCCAECWTDACGGSTEKSIIITLYERIKIPYRKNSYKHNNIIYTINLQDFLHTSKKVLRSLV